LKKNIGYAWLPVELATDGTTVAVHCPDSQREATVVPMPFIDPMKEIPKS
jgi:glycine cleavage system aminomethyltransferase T